MSQRAVAVANAIIKRGETQKKGQGLKDLAWLLDAFNRKESGTVIAKRFSVTRQRVSQWRLAMGQDVYSYVPHRAVRGLIPHTGRQAV